MDTMFRYPACRMTYFAWRFDILFRSLTSRRHVRRMIAMATERKDGKRERNTAAESDDRICKKLMENRELRAELFRQVIPELKGCSREEVVASMEGWEDYPKGLNTENILPGGEMVRYDALFRVRLPGMGRVGIIVNIESQGRGSSVQRVSNRATFYGCSALT
jgi:hypothetical protein